MFRVTSPTSPGEIAQQPRAAPGGGRRRNTQPGTYACPAIALGHVGGSKKWQGALSASSTSHRVQLRGKRGRVRAALLDALGFTTLVPSASFYLKSQDCSCSGLVGVSRVWRRSPRWTPGTIPAPRAWGLGQLLQLHPKALPEELVGSLPGATPTDGVCQKVPGS